MGQRIRARRDTAANWTTTNPVLQAGEFALETNTNKVKIGDGATAWNALAYFAGAGSVGSMVEGVAVVNQSLNVSTSGSVSHGLGKIPDLLSVYFECVTASNGFAVGDRVDASSLAGQVSVSSNASSIFWGTRSVAGNIVPKAGGVVAAINLASFRLNVRCWKVA